MTQDELAKLAYAKIILAIKDLIDDTDTEVLQKFTIHYPDTIKVNNTAYQFTPTTL